MAGPIIILRPSLNSFDWNYWADEAAAPRTMVGDPNQTGTMNLSHAAFPASAKLDGLIAAQWVPIVLASASFGGKTLVIRFNGGLTWTLGGDTFVGVEANPEWGWNGTIAKVDPGTIRVVRQGIVGQASADGFRIMPQNITG